MFMPSVREEGGRHEEPDSPATYRFTLGSPPIGPLDAAIANG
jgi:hypothetical protein